MFTGAGAGASGFVSDDNTCVFNDDGGSLGDFSFGGGDAGGGNEEIKHLILYFCLIEKIIINIRV